MLSKQRVIYQFMKRFLRLNYFHYSCFAGLWRAISQLRVGLLNFGLGFSYYETLIRVRRGVPIPELQTYWVPVKLAQTILLQLLLHWSPADSSVRPHSSCFLHQVIRRGVIPLLIGKTQNF